MTEKYLNESIKKMHFVLLCSGLTLQIKKLTQREKLKKRFVFIVNFIWLNKDLLGEICWLICGIQNGRTFIELTYVSPCITFSFMANLKALFLLYYEDNICDFIDDFQEIESRNVGIAKQDGLKKVSLDFLHFVLRWSNVLNIFLVIIFTVSPLILIAISYIKTKEVDLILPLLILYPFDSHDIKYWPFVYIHQTWSVAIVIVNVAGADYFLYICCTHLRVQFHFLQEEFTKIVKKNHLSKHDVDIFDMELVKLIKWHQELIRLSGMLERIYAKTILYHFVLSSVLICLTGFNVITIENVAYAMMFLVFLIANLLQIYLVCYFGDLLMNSSFGVSDAVFNCKWYYLNAKSRKNLLIVQRRAQKPCKLTAFGFSDVNLRAFMSILSSSWSYFALLKTVYNPTKN